MRRHDWVLNNSKYVAGLIKAYTQWNDARIFIVILIILRRNFPTKNKEKFSPQKVHHDR